MSAQNARPRSQQRLPIAEVRGRHGRAGRSQVLREVIATEQVLERALVPLAWEARQRGVELTCELLPGVGDHVLGSARALVEALTTAALGALQAGVGREICIRVARQFTGFDRSNTILLSVAARDGATVCDLEHLELSLPFSTDEAHALSAMDGRKILIVVPSAHGARVQSDAARRCGATSSTALDVGAAHEQLRSASRRGSDFPLVYIDDAAADATALLRAIRDDTSLGAPRSVVATALRGAARAAFSEAGANGTLVKPVLPGALRTAIATLK